MLNRIKVKCITQDEYKTLTVGKDYEIQNYYEPQNQVLIECDKSYIWWYSLDLFIGYDIKKIKEVYER